MENIKILSHILEMNRGHYISLGDYSVTGIIAPPRVTALKKRHDHESEPTFKSQIASFMGVAIHERAEKMLKLAAAKYKGYTLERSITIPYIINNCSSNAPIYRLLSGRYDILYEQGKKKHLTDIKTANVWKVIFDPNLEDWHSQQNLYAWLLNERGIKLDSINILCFFKDWKQGEALRNKKMPQNQVVEYNLDLWTQQQQEDYLVDRMELHIAEEKTPDADLPACSREDRWERFPDGSDVQYALLKTRSAKRATRVLPTLEEALVYAQGATGFGIDSWIEERFAKRKRCEDYCSVNQFCNHYEAYTARLDSPSGLNNYISLKDLL